MNANDWKREQYEDEEADADAFRAQESERETQTAEVLFPGQRGTTSGFPATVLRHYDGSMYEVRVPGGVCCIDAADFVPDQADR